jgi:peptide/nickel transport system permease protein
MTFYAVRRLAQAILALTAIAALVFSVQTFFLWHVLHLSPAAALVYPDDTAQNIASMNRALGLTQPIPVQFVLWIKSLATGGGFAATFTSYLPPTLELMVLGILIAVVAAIVLAMAQTRFAGSWIDWLIDVFIGLTAVVPSFWLATLSLFLFSMESSVFPGVGYPTPGHGFLTWLYYSILPATILGLSIMGPWTRTLKGSLADAASADYVRTARAKGAPEGRILIRHMFRNSVLPLVTLIGLTLPTLLNTVIVLEVVYSIPGAGQDFYQSLTNLFFDNATTVALILAVVTVLGNVIADLAYGVIDPRITYS